ncbi:DEAD H helicase [Coniophora puteana RWD-64-598 SS2]|uniref:DEAD H helicase n=1 Tax=Coniophora puteana (strain RWD-64-598) TaxID=741705 RepID=A0A5M3N277_CONPW|nr:DEAD H helicase [Coniophora puteana RWD-64-598 SS2]EIW85377.1 DEAD H helicase [Coniophora puteana RWD-64-598 SS2]
MPPKRKGVADKPETSNGQQSKKARGKEKRKDESTWPAYFQDLFKVFKAMNTVLAFVSSRKHLATTFPVVRSSVEGLLKRPLELAKVAELKALLPELIKFAYIARNELRIHGDNSSQARGGRKSPDFSFSSQAGTSSSQLPGLEEEEHVLLLEFAENSKGKKDAPQGLFTMPPAMTPAAVKKLVEQRNDRFYDAVNELLEATPHEEDPVLLLQAAAEEHLPVNPSVGVPSQVGDLKGGNKRGIPEPQDRPTIDEIIDNIQEQEWYQNQIVHRRIVEARQATIGDLVTPLSDSLRQALWDSRNITTLYRHQAQAINALAAGQHVIVSTSTASGKSVIYQVPLIRCLEEDPSATAIFIYPTKALAQDQRTALESLLWASPGLHHVKVSTYDGDTPQDERASIREQASVIFTNFDMMHASILPHEDDWRTFMKNLKLVAVDELHYYSDIMGSHVAQILRRFRRVCTAVGNRRVRFVSCSATISNPLQHMKQMFGVDNVEAITEDSAPSGRKDYLVWDPPYIDSGAANLGKKSSIAEATGLMRFLMKQGVRVILFCKIRKACELAMKTLRADLSAEGRHDVLAKVMPYRGGYNQQDRRRLEKEAFTGNLLGIVATNALELGVDIGVLDAVIMLGFPFGLASFRQQAGRAGRRSRDSLAVLVADGLPIDQHYVNFPDELYNKPTKELIVDLENKIILEAHLQCAAQEMPLSKEEDSIYFGPMLGELCDQKLVRDKEGWYHTHPKFLPYPSKFVSIRGAEEEKYIVIDITKAEPKIIEEIEFSRALFELYEGGVFMHQGLTFIVKEISNEMKTAKVMRADVNWITSPRDFTDVNAVQVYRIKEIAGSSHRAYYGRVDVTTIVYGFYKIRNKQILDTVEIDSPPWERSVTGLWLDVPKSLLGLLRAKNINAAEAIHAACHAWLNRFALAVDLKTECKAAEKEYKSSESARKRPARLIFYDAAAKSGMSAKGFDHVNDVLRRAHDTVESCPCPDGCPNCVHSISCKEGNKVASKLGAFLVLRSLLNLEIEADSIPTQHDDAEGFSTVTEAGFIRPVEGVEIEKASG